MDVLCCVVTDRTKQWFFTGYSDGGLVALQSRPGFAPVNSSEVHVIV